MNATPPPPHCPAHSATPTGSVDLIPLPPGATRYPTSTGLISLAEVVGSDDPHAGYRRLRAEWGPVAGVELEPGVPAWLVMGYRELLTITRQEQLFSRDSRHWRHLYDGVVSADSGLLPMMGWRANVIGADGAEHRRLRTPLDVGVAKIDQRRVRREVEALCADLIAAFSQRGSADLVTEYAAIVPMLALASLFGLDAAEGRELLAAITALFGSQDDSQAGIRQFEEILLDTVRDREKNPGEDMTTVFINHPNLVDQEERLQAIVATISAGNETITAWIAHTLYLMLTDPRFAGRMRGGRLGVDDALDEVLWREPPMNNLPGRYALRDTELGGQTVRAGDCLIQGYAAANDDPAIRGDSDTSDIEPGNRAHVAFSAGPHVCPAQGPARLITRTAVNTAFNLLPDMRLSVPADSITRHPSPWSRIPASLPATFSASPIASTTSV